MADINVDIKAEGAVGQAADASTPVNPKEKTPMCLINELSRFNKLKHQYTLTDEQGPAHKKTFYVQLKVGDEEYNATEGSIKRAQHLAAQQAMAKTKYSRPPPKEPRESFGPHDPAADKVIRLKPKAPEPNLSGAKKLKKPVSQTKPTPAGNATARTLKPPLKSSFTGSGSFQPSGTALKSAQRNGGSNSAQRSLNRARNFMQNRNQSPWTGFGFGLDGPSGFPTNGPLLKRPRLELPPLCPQPLMPRPTGDADLVLRFNNDTLQLKQERIKQEWEKISVSKDLLEIEQKRLDMEREKYRLEIRLLEYQLSDYERSTAEATTASALASSASMSYDHSTRRQDSTSLNTGLNSSLAASPRGYLDPYTYNSYSTTGSSYLPY